MRKITTKIVLLIIIYWFLQSGISSAQRWEIDFTPIADIYTISENELIITSHSKTNSAYSVHLRSDSTYSFAPIIKNGLGPGEMNEISDVEFDKRYEFIWFANRYNGKIVAINSKDGLEIEKLTNHNVIQAISFEKDVMLVSVQPLFDGAFLKQIDSLTIGYLYKDGFCVDTISIPTQFLNLANIKGIENYSPIQLNTKSKIHKEKIVTIIEGFDFVIFTSLKNTSKHKLRKTNFKSTLPFEIINDKLYGKGQRITPINSNIKTWNDHVYISSGLGVVTKENKYKIEVFENENKIDSFDLNVNYSRGKLKYAIYKNYIFYMDGNSLIKIDLNSISNNLYKK